LSGNHLRLVQEAWRRECFEGEKKTAPSGTKSPAPGGTVKAGQLFGGGREQNKLKLLPGGDDTQKNRDPSTEHRGRLPGIHAGGVNALRY